MFSTNAGTFMRGTGCAKCAWFQNGIKHRMTQDEFVRASTDIHGDNYSYFCVEYKLSDEKVNILCNGCGEIFSMTPEAHLAGQGCRGCGYKRNGKGSQRGFEDFVADSRSHHGDKFSYEHVKPIWAGSKKTKFKLFCKEHKEWFSTTAQTHSKGAGCPKCSKIAGGLKNRGNTDSFVKEALAKFGSSFDYSMVEYIKNNVKVKIRCLEHDRWFNVTPNAHLHPDSTGGCPACARAGYSAAKPGYLYILHDDELTKVGITNRKPEVRCKSVTRESCKNFKVLKEYYFTDGEVPRALETALLRELRLSYKQPLERFDGYKETFIHVNLASLLNRIEELISQQTAAKTATKEHHSSNNQAAQAA
jgi:hypothetical protein